MGRSKQAGPLAVPGCQPWPPLNAAQAGARAEHTCSAATWLRRSAGSPAQLLGVLGRQRGLARAVWLGTPLCPLGSRCRAGLLRASASWRRCVLSQNAWREASSPLHPLAGARAPADEVQGSDVSSAPTACIDLDCPPSLASQRRLAKALSPSTPSARAPAHWRMTSRHVAMTTCSCSGRLGLAPAGIKHAPGMHTACASLGHTQDSSCWGQGTLAARCTCSGSKPRCGATTQLGSTEGAHWQAQDGAFDVLGAERLPAAPRWAAP